MSLLNKHITKHLSVYCHNELDKKIADEVKAHVDECQVCLNKLALIQEGVRLASHLKRVQAPEAILQEIEKTLAESRKRPHIGRRGLLWQRVLPMQWPIPRLAAVALLVAILAGALIYFLRPSEKGGAKFVWDMTPYLEMAENASGYTLPSVLASNPEGFVDVSKQDAFTVLNQAPNTVFFSANEFQLIGQRIRDFEGNKVVQFVFRRQGKAYAVFVAPLSVGFDAGGGKISRAQFGKVPAGKIERGGVLAVFWGVADVHCCSISEKGTEEDLALLIEPFNNVLEGKR